jgi:hypothetical protein
MRFGPRMGLFLLSLVERIRLNHAGGVCERCGESASRATPGATPAFVATGRYEPRVYTRMMTDDDRRVDEIRAWFDERGYDLFVHEIPGHGWRAPVMAKQSLIGAGDYGVGDTALAAAEDARARFERDHASGGTAYEKTGGIVAGTSLRGAVEVKVPVPPGGVKAGGFPPTEKIEPGVETDMATPIEKSKTKAIKPAVETDTAMPIPNLDEKIETLTRFEWRVAFEFEPDGKVTGLLLDRDSGEILKMALGDDFEDAWLGLGIGTTPPSDELRRERERRVDDH